MNLPPIDVEMMQAAMGLPTNAFPVVPVVDFSIIPKDSKRPTKSFTSEDAQRLFGITESVKMDFVPQMLLAVAMDQVALFYNYCRDNKLKEFNKHNRLLKSCVDAYIEDQQKMFGPAFRAYLFYTERFFNEVNIDRVKMMFSFGNVANKQIPEGHGRNIAVHIAVIHRLIDAAEKWDRQMDIVIADKMQRPIYHRQSKFIRLIKSMCIAIEDDFNLRLEPDVLDDLDMGLFINRAARLAEKIVNEEGLS